MRCRVCTKILTISSRATSVGKYTVDKAITFCIACGGGTELTLDQCLHKSSVVDVFQQLVILGHGKEKV